MKRIGILYYPLSEKVCDLVQKLEQLLSSQGVTTWYCSAWEEEEARAKIPGTDLILSIGGDGTILRTSRIVIPKAVPILGINLGKLGFITEISASEALSYLPRLLKGEGWIEERAMLQVQTEDKCLHALNDAVLRSAAVRLLSIEVRIDGAVLTNYRADGVIIATATGSTSYALASGGPILNPQSKDVVLQPICCHLGFGYALVLPQQSTIDLKVIQGEKILLSIDGQIELPLSQQQNVRVKLSPHVARFLRIHQPSYFYSSLWQKLSGRRNES
jgi:NAD+ kinase